MLCSTGMFHQWGLAVFLLCSPVPLYGRPIDALSNRMRRSVSHAQLMHDKGRSLQEFKRRLWLQELLDEVHTADERTPPPQNKDHSHSFSKITIRQKSMFRLNKEGVNLPQETNQSLACKEQPLKVATKRKKKVKSCRRRESEKRRRRARSVRTQESQKTQDLGLQTTGGLWVVLH